MRKKTLVAQQSKKPACFVESKKEKALIESSMLIFNFWIQYFSKRYSGINGLSHPKLGLHSLVDLKDSKARSHFHKLLLESRKNTEFILYSREDELEFHHLFHVFQIKAFDWLHDFEFKMVRFYRLETLLNPKNFKKYLNTQRHELPKKKLGDALFETLDETVLQSVYSQLSEESQGVFAEFFQEQLHLEPQEEPTKEHRISTLEEYSKARSVCQLIDTLPSLQLNYPELEREFIHQELQKKQQEEQELCRMTPENQVMYQYFRLPDARSKQQFLQEGVNQELYEQWTQKKNAVFATLQKQTFDPSVDLEATEFHQLDKKQRFQYRFHRFSKEQQERFLKIPEYAQLLAPQQH